MLTENKTEEVREELTVESLAAQVFQAGDDSILGNLPSSEEMSNHGSELAALMRIAALIHTKDDTEIENYFKNEDSYNNWLNLLERIDKTIDVENAIVRLLENAGDRLLVGAARFQLNRKEQYSRHSDSHSYTQEQSDNSDHFLRIRSAQ